MQILLNIINSQTIFLALTSASPTKTTSNDCFFLSLINLMKLTEPFNPWHLAEDKSLLQLIDKTEERLEL